jgi:hypothetical protein
MHQVNPCEKCRFYKPGNYTRTGTCLKYIAYRGRGKLVYEFADSVRFSERKCGPEGRFFVARDPEKKASRERQELWKYLVEQDE